ncbi:MAG TPA: hypothetical protein VIT91_00950 [Chthoniobacterales bacterium]
MLQELQQPGYAHVLINHVPIIGAVLGLIALLVGLFFKQRAALMPALVILFIAGISVWPVYETGEAAYKPIRKIAGDPGSDWLDEHMDRADRAAWLFFVLAGLSAAAIAAPFRWPKAGVPLALAAGIAAVACAGAGVWIAQPGGLVRHTEFRLPNVTPPGEQETTHTHEH